MSGHYAYTFASDAVDPLKWPDWEAYRRKGLEQEMWYYSPPVHVAAFQLPAFVDRVLGQAAIKLAMGGTDRRPWSEEFMGLVLIRPASPCLHHRHCPVLALDTQLDHMAWHMVLLLACLPRLTVDTPDITAAAASSLARSSCGRCNGCGSACCLARACHRKPGGGSHHRTAAR
jgi:hypothetical protein